MKRNNLRIFSRQYVLALQKHLERGTADSLKPALDLGRRAISLNLETLALARVHEHALITLVLPGCSDDTRASLVRRAGAFFAEAIVPIENTHRAALEATIKLGRLNRKLQARTVDLASSNEHLKEQIGQRKGAEKSLVKSQQHYAVLLEQSRLMQEQLRLLSREMLSAQEEERRKISRELHDVIAQTLTSINVRLGTLQKEAAMSKEGLARSIAKTQMLVEHSVDIVQRFARELRPRVLDDLGLIPALHTFMKGFREQTGIGVSLSACEEVERVNGDKRTVLYRVAQEALTNVARHAQASRAVVDIKRQNGSICMRIRDNGKGFTKERAFQARKDKRLGLMGMRERVEMVGGNFLVTSTLGKGTSVVAEIPVMTASNRSQNKRHPAPKATP